MTNQKIINCLEGFFFSFQFLEEILTNDNDSNCWSRHPNGETLFYIAFAKNTFFTLFFLQFILDLKTKKNIHTQFKACNFSMTKRLLDIFAICENNNVSF